MHHIIFYHNCVVIFADMSVWNSSSDGQNNLNQQIDSQNNRNFVVEGIFHNIVKLLI